jgi:hypothetical protein
MAVAAHQGIDVLRGTGPVRRQHLAPAAGRALVPQLDIADGNGIDVGHVLLLLMSPAEPAERLSKVRPGQSITSEVIDFDLPITRSHENRPAASDARWISVGEKNAMQRAGVRRLHRAAVTMISTL